MGAKLNLDFYSGTDFYSDGNIENELFEMAKTNKNIYEVLEKDLRWPILYHLSPIRQNIINWYPFREKSSLLEIGGGCGAITGSLCKQLDNVTVVELSKRRSQINFERHKEHSNLEIIVGNLNDIKFDEKFDYITLNGVFEYAGAFTKTSDPYRDFLINIRKLLKPNGKLIIAIENRYGLKYFAGAKEDHTAKLFDGITGYIDNTKVKTFGKIEIENLLYSVNFNELEFYYPHPDYKMPLEIYSDKYLPSPESILRSAPNFDHDRMDLFNEPLAYQGIIENEQFEFFANSFLIICKESN